MFFFYLTWFMSTEKLIKKYKLDKTRLENAEFFLLFFPVVVVNIKMTAVTINLLYYVIFALVLFLL